MTYDRLVYGLNHYSEHCVLWAVVMERHGVKKTVVLMAAINVPITVAITALRLLGKTRRLVP